MTFLHWSCAISLRKDYSAQSVNETFFLIAGWDGRSRCEVIGAEEILLRVWKRHLKRSCQSAHRKGGRRESYPLLWRQTQGQRCFDWEDEIEEFNIESSEKETPFTAQTGKSVPTFVTFKICLSCSNASMVRQPSYLRDLINAPAKPGLRSVNKGLLQEHCSKTLWGNKSFATGAAILWDSLPVALWTCDTISTFLKPEDPSVEWSICEVTLFDWC